MNDNLPIDRVRNREEDGPEPFTSDRETFTQKQAKLDREASNPDARQPEDAEEFKHRMEEKLAEKQHENDNP